MAEALNLAQGKRRYRLALAGLLLVAAAMVAGYMLTLRTIWVEIDGRTLVVHSHLATVGEALREARIAVQPEDRVDPPADTPLQSGLHVRVQRARTMYINVDGAVQVHRTLLSNVGDALTEAGVRWIPEDRITIGGQVVPPEQPLYVEVAVSRSGSSRGGRSDALSQAPAPLQVSVQRAVPIALQDGQTPYTFLTTAATLGEALVEKGITLYAADKIQPPLDTPIQPGLHAYIDRSCPVTLLVDGQVRATRTRTKTVADLLKEEGITLGALDYTRPALTEPVVPDLQVAVVRVEERETVEHETIPFEVEYRGNPALEIDQQQVDNVGAPGVFSRSLKVRYENGIEVSRLLAKEWVEKPPQNRIISYGTKIVERQLATPGGTVTYWRKIRVLVTAYSPATCGKAPDDPTYGITRTGLRATKGIIAVDPSVIPMMSRLYVPGYGTGLAADTGSLIKGQHIDLAYDDNNLVHWWRWVDVYLLSPPPPRSQIRWTLPNYPREN